MNAFEVLDSLWSVVVDERDGGCCRLLWSPEQQGWRRSFQGSPYFDTEPVEDPRVTPDGAELEHIMMLVEPFFQSGICQHCGLFGLGDHFVAPNVFGAATLYCVQRPHTSVLAAFNGTGMRKHWGSLRGCHAVDRNRRFVTDEYGREEIVYGDGMVAAKVRDFAWCTRCLKAGARLSDHAAAESVTADELEEHEEQGLLARRAINMANRHI